MSSKSSKSNYRKEYVYMRVKDNKEVDHKFILTTFHYSSEWIKKNDPARNCGFNHSENLIDFINDILNNSDFNLISVSEDQNSISYHFVGEINDDDYETIDIKDA